MTAETSPPDMPMMLPEMVDQLSPPPVPEQISWMPQTWGWAMIAAILVILLASWAWRRWRRWKANAYRREALAELEQRLSRDEGVSALAEIVRRTALVAFPRQQVANLRGEEWAAFLDRTLPGKQPRFAGSMGELLTTGPYRPSKTIDDAELDRLTRLVREWIRRHRPTSVADSMPLEAP